MSTKTSSSTIPKVSSSAKSSQSKSPVPRPRPAKSGSTSGGALPRSGGAPPRKRPRSPSFSPSPPPPKRRASEPESALSAEIWKMFGKDRRSYIARDVMSDDEDMEADASVLMKEEMRRCVLSFAIVAYCSHDTAHDSRNAKTRWRWKRKNATKKRSVDESANARCGRDRACDARTHRSNVWHLRPYHPVTEWPLLFPAFSPRMPCPALHYAARLLASQEPTPVSTIQGPPAPHPPMNGLDSSPFPLYYHFRS